VGGGGSRIWLRDSKRNNLKKTFFCYRGRYTQTPGSVSPPSCSNIKVVTKKVENNLRKNEVNLPNHIHLMWQVDYTFSGGIITQAVFGGDTDHGGSAHQDIGIAR